MTDCVLTWSQSHRGPPPCRFRLPRLQLGRFPWLWGCCAVESICFRSGLSDSTPFHATLKLFEESPQQLFHRDITLYPKAKQEPHHWRGSPSRQRWLGDEKSPRFDVRLAPRAVAYVAPHNRIRRLKGRRAGSTTKSHWRCVFAAE